MNCIHEREHEGKFVNVGHYYTVVSQFSSGPIGRRTVISSQSRRVTQFIDVFSIASSPENQKAVLRRLQTNKTEYFTEEIIPPRYKLIYSYHSTREKNRGNQTTILWTSAVHRFTTLRQLIYLSIGDILNFKFKINDITIITFEKRFPLWQLTIFFIKN